MTQSKPTLDEALDSLGDGSGTIEVDQERGHAEVDVVEADRLGVRVKGVRVHRDKGLEVEHEAKALPERMRSLSEPVEPVEIAPDLGGATLRSKPRDDRYFEVQVEPTRTDIRRTRVDDDGERHETDWTMTRDQLDRLLEEASGPEES